MWIDFWDWLGQLPASNASFVGTLTGSSLGLLAILIGALFNAHLNRRRDDAQRDAERRLVASALTAELAGLHRTLVDNAKAFDDHAPNSDSEFLFPDLSQSVRVMPNMLPKIGLLDPETIQKVIAAYILVEQYTQALLTRADGRLVDIPSNRRLIQVRAGQVKTVVAINEIKAQEIQKAIDSLAPYLS